MRHDVVVSRIERVHAHTNEMWPGRGVRLTAVANSTQPFVETLYRASYVAPSVWNSLRRYCATASLPTNRGPAPNTSYLGRPERTGFHTGLCFTADVFFFSPRFLRDPSTDRPETLPHDRKLVEFYKLASKFRGRPPKKFGAKNMKIFGQFWTTTDFDREYLRNETTYPKSERRTNYENSSCV